MSQDGYDIAADEVEQRRITEHEREQAEARYDALVNRIEDMAELVKARVRMAAEKREFAWAVGDVTAHATYVGAGEAYGQEERDLLSLLESAVPNDDETPDMDFGE